MEKGVSDAIPWGGKKLVVEQLLQNDVTLQKEKLNTNYS